MTQRPVMMLGTAALMAQLLVFGGCSSNDTGSSGAGGSSATGAGGVTVVTGSGGAGGVNTDPNCTSTNAKANMTCTVDCMIPCGFQNLGTKVCSCVGGIYAACPCPAPTGWGGAATADYCDVVVPSDTGGLAATLKNTPCDDKAEFTECIGRDGVTGSTPQGCACLTNPLTMSKQWYCGSTNKWFSLSM